MPSRLTGTPSKSTPYVPDHQARITQIVNKYTSPNPLMAASMASADPAVVSTAQRLDANRVARGTAPYSSTETAVGMAAAQRNAPIVPRPDQPMWQDAITDVTGFVQGVGKLPGLLVNELSEVRNVDLGKSFEGVDNPGEAIGAAASLPGVRMLPGSFVAGAFRPGGGGLGELADHPVYTALDVLPFASKAAKGSKTVGTAERLARESLPARETFGQLTPSPRTPPIRTFITKFQRGNPESRVVPMVDRATGLEIPGAFELPSNRIGQAFASAKARATSRGIGRFTSEAHGAASQEMMQGANKFTSDAIVRPIEQALKGEKVDILPAQLFADLQAMMRDTDIPFERQQALYNEVSKARDRSFLDDLPENERAYVSKIEDIQNQLRDIYVERGELTPVTFKHGTEYLLPDQAKKVLGARQRVSTLGFLLDARKRIGERFDDGQVAGMWDEVVRISEGSPVARGAESVSFPNMKSRRAAIRANLAALAEAGYDVSGPLEALRNAKTVEQLSTFSKQVAGQVPVLRQTANLLEDGMETLKAARGNDRVVAEAYDRFKRGDWAGARERLGQLDKRTKSAFTDLDVAGMRDELRMRAQADRVRSDFDKLGFTDEALAEAVKVRDRREALATPQRFNEYVREQADREFLSSVEMSDLAPEQKLAVAEKVDAGLISQISQIDGIEFADDLIELYKTHFKDARAQWQKFAEQGIDPIYVHKVSPADVRRMEHPFVLNQAPKASALKQGVSPETFAGVQDLGLSVSHYAYEILLRDATTQFLDWVSGRFGVDAATVQARYLERAERVAAKTGRPVADVVSELVNNDWAPLREAEYMGAYQDILAQREGVLSAQKPRRGGRPEALLVDGNRQVMIPREIHNNLGRLLPKDPTTLGKVLAAPMTIFRTAVLPLSLRWHYNNILGNAVMTAVRTNPVDMVMFAREAWRMKGSFGDLPGAPSSTSLKESAFGRTVTDATRLPMAQRIAVAHQYAAGVTQSRLLSSVLERMGPRSIKWIEQVGDKAGAGVQWSYNMNQMFDDFFRSMAYLSGSKKSMKAQAKRLGIDVSDLDAMSLKEAQRAGVELSREVLQNWDRMTPIERGVIRNIFPFYSWTAHILRYVGRLPGDHPWRMSIMARFAETEYNDHLSGVPENLRQLFFLGNPDSHGDVVAINTDSFNPFRDMGNWVSLAGFLVGQEGGDMSAILGQLNPLISTSLETLGVDPMKGPDLYPDLEYDPTTGGLRANTKALPGTMLTNLVPQLGGLSALFGWNKEFSDLARTNTSAAGRMFWGAVGAPMPIRQVNVDEEQMKAEINVWRQMNRERNAALKSGDIGSLRRWPALGAYVDQLERESMESRRLKTPGGPGASMAEILFSGLTGVPAG